ncbi:MAG: cobalt-precorrin-4 C(11)-methyltransferase [Methanosarcinales archaeon]|nr:cobalt-precorrin-4 C(11)-methyltransferase [Methanosarcinales archaeon]
MKERMVYFIGAGPGNPKLITIKGYELLKEADCVLYADSLINPEVLNYTNRKLIDSYELELKEFVELMVKFVNKNKNMVRLHSRDSSLYGSIIEQIAELKKHDIKVKRVSGVSSIFATAASLNTQLSLKGISDTLIITRPKGDTLEKDLIKKLPIKNTTMAVFLGTSKISEVMGIVQYSKDAPVAVAYHAS